MFDSIGLIFSFHYFLRQLALQQGKILIWWCAFICWFQGYILVIFHAHADSQSNVFYCIACPTQINVRFHFFRLPFSCLSLSTKRMHTFLLFFRSFWWLIDVEENERKYEARENRAAIRWIFSIYFVLIYGLCSSHGFFCSLLRIKVSCFFSHREYFIHWVSLLVWP